MRIGFGYVVHRLGDGRPLVLGGVHIPYDKGLLGHSDADVLLHAICDALLGAAALGDIGKHFPDTDQRFKDIRSTELLTHVGALIRQEGYTVGNIDSTVVLQAPKIAPHIEAMRNAIAASLEISTGLVSIKATTNEGLGFIGASQGVVSYAVALLEQVEI
jgi:2-C-methyl-D-erythritol 2,4-cyclodiphosphate synthase